MDYLLKASAVVVLFYLCYSLFLKKETFFQHNRWFLLLGLTVALLFPLIVIPVEIIVEPVSIPETAFYVVDNVNTNSAVAENDFHWTDALPVLYTIGVIVFFIQFILQFGSLILLLFKNPKTKDGIYTYIIVKSKVSPFSFFKWIVYNPDLFEEQELQLIINHEKVHVRQLHSVDIIVSRLACVLFWFNPIIWLYKNHVHQNLEYIADYNTQDSAENDKDYQHLLLKTSVANQHLPITTNFYNSLIKKRIIMLNKSRSAKMKQWKFLLVLPLLAGLLLSTNTKEVYIEKPTPSMTVESLEIPLNTFEATPEGSMYKAIEYIFKKDMTDEELEKIQSELKKKGVTMTIDELDRNDNGEISNIRISFKTELSSANYGVMDTDGIKPFVFVMNDLGGIKVGTIDEGNTFMTKEEGENVYIIRTDKDKKEKTKKGKGSNQNQFVYETDDDDKVIYLNGNAKVWTDDGENTFTFEADSVRINDEIEKSKWIIRGGKKDLNAIHRDNVKIITRASSENNVFKSDSSKIYIRSTDSEPLYIINGKRVDKDQLRILDPKRINSMDVLKGDKATAVYGSDGENGVIVIRADSISNYNFKFGKGAKAIYTGDSQKNPWKVKTEVQSVEYIDIDDLNKSGFSYYVTKTTTDKQFGIYKSKLEKRGIKAKFSKIKRNAAGEITSIKISLSDDSGSKASATWSDAEETIPKILVGKKGGKLRVSSSTF